MTRTRLTIVGAGVIGKHHAQVARDLADEIELVAVVDPVAKRATKIAEPVGAATYLTLAEALEGTETDLVVICTPTGLHGEPAIEAMRAGKAVIIEKPAEVTLDKTDELIAARDDAGVVVSVISQHRFDSSTERIEVEDVAVGVVRFESGALGVLHASTAAYPGMSAHLHVHGSQGSAVIDSDGLTFIHTAEPSGPGADDYGTPGDGNQVDRYPGTGAPAVSAGADPGPVSQAHTFQYRNVLAAMRGAEPVRVTLEENRRSIAVITGVYESARTGKPVAL